MKDVYADAFVESLFDTMSGSYSRMNYITSFGFSEIWRRQCVEAVSIQPGKVTVDLLSGKGECWKSIFKRSDQNSKLIAIDFSDEMNKGAEERKQKYPQHDIKILNENVFDNSIQSNSADFVVSGFGLKTFNDQQLGQLAQEIERILKVGGKFSLIDISVPKGKGLKMFFMFYLKNIIPILGKIFLGNPDSYRMLGIYTTQFGNAEKVAKIFNQHKFEVEYVPYFFGCASGITGTKID